MTTASAANRGRDTRDSLLEAAIHLIRVKGYADMRVDDVCAAAGVSKGAFFHHFESKDALAAAAATRFEDGATHAYATAKFNSAPDPVAKVLGYIETRRDWMDGRIEDVSCVNGTMLQEVYATREVLREVAGNNVMGHVEWLTELYRDALDYAHLDSADLDSADVDQKWDARQLAIYTQAVVQGAFVMAKATGSTETARACVKQLHQHVALMFSQPTKPTAQ